MPSEQYREVMDPKLRARGLSDAEIDLFHAWRDGQLNEMIGPDRLGAYYARVIAGDSLPDVDELIANWRAGKLDPQAVVVQEPSSPDRAVYFFGSLPRSPKGGD
jgi:hypothetical protein